MNERTIHTYLYSNIAKEVLQSVEGQLSDGMWENSPAMEKYWRFSNVTTAPDGEVLIEISAESSKYDKYARKCLSNGFSNMSDDEIIKWFAAKVKHIMVTELKDNNIVGGWKRDNDKFETQYLNYHEKITVDDVYFIYDYLMDRDIASKYGVMSITSIISIPKSKTDTKKEEIRRANIAKLEAEWTVSLKMLEAEKKAAIEKLETEFNEKRNALNDDYRNNINKIKA